MAFEGPGTAVLDYAPCRYGHSRLIFRGPKRRLTGRFVAAIGGSETYGKYVPRPYPALLEARLGLPVVNFGCMYAGLEAILEEPELTAAASAACLSIVQAVGVPNMSNAYYAVHPRRNDRFVRATPALERLFGGIDTTEVHFTRHLVSLLARTAPERFAVLAEDLRRTWVARMTGFLGRLNGRAILLWVEAPEGTGGAGADPLAVDAAMIGEVAPHAAAVVQVRPSVTARLAGTDGMVFPALESAAAAGLPGPAVHAEIAAALAPAVEALLRT